MVRATLRALPWAAALTGTTAVVWALLRLRRALAHGGGKHVPAPVPVILTDEMHDAISLAVAAEWDIRRPNGGGQRMRAASLSLPCALRRLQRVQVLPAALIPVPVQDDLPPIFRQALVLHDAPLETGWLVQLR